MRPVLHVCVTCRAGRTLAEGDTAPGRLLHDEFVSRETLRGRDETGPIIREVVCLAVCERGCAAAIEAPGKWRILLGHLDLSHASDVLDYASLYAASPNGTVLPSKRAASLRHAVLGRIPA